MSVSEFQKSYIPNASPTNIQWSPDSWRQLPIKQPPNYLDLSKLEAVEKKLSNVAPLVFAGEVRTLQEELAKASAGQGFLLMGGDCAEVIYRIQTVSNYKFHLC